MDEIDRHTDGDRRVRDIKDREYPEIDKIDHRAETKPIDPIPDRASQDQTKRQAVHVRDPGTTRLMGTVRDKEQDKKARGDHSKKDGSVVTEQAEGGSGIPDKGQVQHIGNERHRPPGSKMAESEKLGKLVYQNNEPSQSVEEDH